MNSEYTVHVFEFIECIIRCFVILEDKTHALQSDTSLTFFDELDSSFILKLDVNLNIIARKYQMHLSTHNATY